MSVICEGDQRQTNYNHPPGGEDVVPIINISLQTIHRRPPISGKLRQWPNDGVMMGQRVNAGPSLPHRWVTVFVLMPAAVRDNAGMPRSREILEVTYSLPGTGMRLLSKRNIRLLKYRVVFSIHGSFVTLLSYSAKVGLCRSTLQHVGIMLYVFFCFMYAITSVV